ncbi:hypothetical protein [Streptomyces sp. NPDC001880]
MTSGTVDGGQTGFVLGAGINSAENRASADNIAEIVVGQSEKISLEMPR